MKSELHSTAGEQPDLDEQSLSKLIKQTATVYTPPPGLQQAIANRLRQESAPTREFSPASRQSWWGKLSAAHLWPRFAGTYAAGLLSAWALFTLIGSQPLSDPTAAEISSGHIRSLMAQHLTDVSSSDQHTVKPWLAGKLDFSPPVIDLKDKSYPLVGARLDYVQGRTVAALVYRHGGHMINVYVWPSNEPDHGPRKIELLRSNGYAMMQWTAAGMQWWSVSDQEAAGLNQFSNTLAQAQMQAQ